jgi:hypothetical protein
MDIFEAIADKPTYNIVDGELKEADGGEFYLWDDVEAIFKEHIEKT